MAQTIQLKRGGVDALSTSITAAIGEVLVVTGSSADGKLNGPFVVVGKGETSASLINPVQLGGAPPTLDTNNKQLNGTLYYDTGSSVLYRLDSSGNTIISSSQLLQTPTDGAYDDGLLPLTANSTTVADAIDDINEVLAGLAPSAAPALDDIGEDETGVGAKLSFGSSNLISGYTNVTSGDLSSPASNLSSIDVNGAYNAGTTSNDVRIGIIDGRSSYQVITGKLNDDVSADSDAFVNYGNDAFKDGDKGVLALFVNDNSTPVHSVSLSGSNDAIGTDVNGNSSGFINLSAAIPAHFKGTGNELTVFRHRSGSFQVGTNEQRVGWNYARVEHQLPTETRETNFVEWVNETNNDALSATSENLTFSGAGSRTISGITYYTSFTSTYKAQVTNVYKNVYSTDGSAINYDNNNTSVVTFDSHIATGSKILHAAGNTVTTDNVAPTRALPALNTSLANLEDSTLNLTGSLKSRTDIACVTAGTAFTIDLDGISHPVKTNISNGGSESLTGLLLDNRNNDSTLQLEKFILESTGRVPAATYDTQNSLSTAIGTFSSATSLVAGGNADLLVFPGTATANSGNGKLVYPTQGTNGGDFGGISNGPSNPDYSTATGNRTFYRAFRNSGGSTANGSITIKGTGTIVAYNSGLSGNEFYVRIKYPGSTAYLDLATNPGASDNLQTDNHGCLVGGLDSSLNSTATNTFTTVNGGGGANMAGNDYIVVEITAAITWTGEITEISIDNF
jgi:hypothetical protein